jgi:hypothetical protein
VGNLFNDLSQAYLYRQMLQGQNAGNQGAGGQFFGVSSPHKKYAGT